MGDGGNATGYGRRATVDVRRTTGDALRGALYDEMRIRGDRHSNDDDDEYSPGGGAGGAGGSSRGAAPPPLPELESDDDDVQEVIPQHRHDSTNSGLQLLGLHTAMSTAPRVIEPKNPRQVLTGPHSKEWREAMDQEIQALESRDTWVLVDRAAIKGRRILFGKWVFRMKTAADVTIECFKARWVVRGYDQRHVIDFNQTFVPVSRHTSVRILLDIAAARHLPLRRIDVKNAFLYALVDAVIYVEQPHTYASNNYLTIPECIAKISAGAAYCSRSGLNISCLPEAIYLSAAKYAIELGKRFNIAPAPLSTPYRTPGPNHKPDNKTLSPAGLQTYQQQLGCVLFASVTYMPDLSYIASQLAQYSRKPMAENFLDLQRALQLFISMPNIELCYSTVNTSSFNLTGYVDADHAADRTIDGPELAELITARAAVREGLYLKELLQETKIPTSPTFCLHCDNQSAIRITNKPRFVNRTKHIALRYFFVKDEVDKGKVDLTYCLTGDMAAEFFTKRVSRQQYQHCSELSGVVKQVKTHYG
ncbi:unnamed protein product [Closterium sp. NIES-53]